MGPVPVMAGYADPGAAAMAVRPLPARLQACLDGVFGYVAACFPVCRVLEVWGDRAKEGLRDEASYVVVLPCPCTVCVTRVNEGGEVPMREVLMFAPDVPISPLEGTLPPAKVAGRRTG